MRQLVAAGPHRLSLQSLGRWRSFNPLFRRAGSIEVPLGPPPRATVTIPPNKKSCCVQWQGWAVPRPPRPDRYKHIDVINKRGVLLRATVGTYSAQTPPPSELRVSGGASLTA